MPHDGDVSSWWQAFQPAERPALFHLLAVAADLPRFGDSATLAAMIGTRDIAKDVPQTARSWPELAQVGDELIRLQRLVDRPVVADGSQAPEAYSRTDVGKACQELAENRCVTTGGFFDEDPRRALQDQIEALAARRAGTWDQLERDEAPDLFLLVDEALASEHFHRLTGFDLERDAYTLTLSLQDLDRAGIGWHRDLYWPREWVGEDVFTVLYGLGDDSPSKGGAFLYYVPGSDTLYASYRRQHQATVLWNARHSEERLLHAVSGYLGEDTSRHLLILQCLRRA